MNITLLIYVCSLFGWSGWWLRLRGSVHVQLFCPSPGLSTYVWGSGYVKTCPPCVWCGLPMFGFSRVAWVHLSCMFGSKMNSRRCHQPFQHPGTVQHLQFVIQSIEMDDIDKSTKTLFFFVHWFSKPLIFKCTERLNRFCKDVCY